MMRIEWELVAMNWIIVDSWYERTVFIWYQIDYSTIDSAIKALENIRKLFPQLNEKEK